MKACLLDVRWPDWSARGSRRGGLSLMFAILGFSAAQR
jgi:hypothetical protein